jgi:hypothetical protein
MEAVLLESPFYTVQAESQLPEMVVSLCCVIFNVYALLAWSE